jgi:phenylpropionate dioxygenase-like ring-hydroxylating dioxygenase large terminal subunit
LKAEFYKEQVLRVLSMAEKEQGDQASDSHRLRPADYLDDDLLAKEKAMFRRMPLILGHSSEIEKPGDFVVRELEGRSWIIVRGKDNIARAFLNYCQHRGTRLLHEDGGNCRHRLVCPYHAWTYNSAGELIGVPRSDLFPGLEKSKKGLKAGHLQEAYGLLWLTQELPSAFEGTETLSIKSFLNELHYEFEKLDLSKWHVYFDKTRSLKANWKFPIFAFLESYHLAVLHKDSIGDFFLENVAYSEQLGLHIRSFVPRKNVLDLRDADLEKTTLAEFITPTNILFPNVCMIAHPTSLSIISMFPGDTAGTSSWRHMLLTPQKPETKAEKAHYDKTIRVLDETTYEREDFWVSEQSQEGINAGALDEIVLSTNEHLLKVFDDLVRANIK